MNSADASPWGRLNRSCAKPTSTSWRCTLRPLSSSPNFWIVQRKTVVRESRTTTPTTKSSWMAVGRICVSASTETITPLTRHQFTSLSNSSAQATRLTMKIRHKFSTTLSRFRTVNRIVRSWPVSCQPFTTTISSCSMVRVAMRGSSTTNLSRSTKRSPTSRKLFSCKLFTALQFHRFPVTLA